MLQPALKFLRRHWHELGLVPAIVAGAYLTFGWSELAVLQRLLLLNFIVVLLHQLEEYRLPGGFPAVANLVLLRSPTPDRYPVNQNSAMVANVFFAYLFYLLPVFLPDVIWLGLGPVLIGAVVQLVGHGIVINRKLGSFYNPGLATTVLGHVPVARRTSIGFPPMAWRPDGIGCSRAPTRFRSCFSTSACSRSEFSAIRTHRTRSMRMRCNAEESSRSSRRRRGGAMSSRPKQRPGFAQRPLGDEM